MNSTIPQEEAITFIPFPGQDRIFTSKARFIFASAGQRGGKTKAGCFWAYTQMSIPGVTGMIAANTLDQLQQSVLDKFFSEFPQLRRYWIKRDKMLVLPNGSRTYFRSLDNPELIRGLNLHWQWADEIDGQNMNTWKILEGRSSNTRGRILGTSSIYRRSFIYEMYKKYNKDPDYDFITWSSVDNPSFPPEEYERLKKTWDPIDFEREFGGQFSFATGQVYPLQDDHFIDAVPEGITAIEYVYGLDYGINDPNVITVNMLGSDGNWYIVDEYWEPNLSIDQVNHWIMHFITKYQRKPYATCQDPSGGIARNSLVTACRPRDAIKEIIERTKLIRNLIYQKKIFVLKKCVNTCREFDQHVFSDKNPELPEDKNNHCMDSFGYALHTTWDELKHRTKKKMSEDEDVSPFWQRRKELYKNAQSKDNYLNEYEREVDGWSEFY